MIIYKALNLINGKIYVGMTSKSLSKRIKEHLLSNYTPFQKALNKYGMLSFDFSVIDTADSKEVLVEKEKYWISQMGCMSPIGYNLTHGGDGGALCGEALQRMSKTKRGRKIPEEIRKKMSEAQRNRKPASMETRKKMSESRIGIKLSEQTRKKIGDLQRGKKRNPMLDETKKKISLAHKGRKGRLLSEEEKAQLSERWKGDNNPNRKTPISNEHREKLSESHKGKTQSRETREKKSESLKLAYKEGRMLSWNKGKATTDEVKAKISKSLSGKNNPNYGKTFSQEHRLRLSESRMSIVREK